MNEEKINQILKNQWAIMKSLFSQDEESDAELISCLDNTNNILNPSVEKSIKEKTEDAFCEVNE